MNHKSNHWCEQKFKRQDRQDFCGLNQAVVSFPRETIKWGTF
jgi:hypothetical protein